MTTFICDFKSIPRDIECYAMIWSEGKACKGCYRDDCYRRGWRVRAVLKDNTRRAREKRERTKDERSK